MMVSSRIFNIDADGISDSFIPYADMMSHKGVPNTRWTYKAE